MRVERRRHWEVLPAMQGRHHRVVQLPEERKMQVVDMKMQDIELGRLGHDLVKHHHVKGDRIMPFSIQPQGAVSAGNDIGARDRVAACEQRHVVAESDELFREIGHYTLSAPVKSRGHAFNQRRNLRNLHQLGSVLKRVIANNHLWT